jgi:hypothetical protein
MKKVFIIHGFGGSPNGGWRPWLMSELEKLDIYACSLSMPGPAAPVLSEWLEEIDRYVKRDKDDEIYLIGHSLGGSALLNYFQQYDSNVEGVIFVSSPCRKRKDSSKIDGFLNDFNYELIKSKIKNIAVIQGDDDPNVSMLDAELIAKETDGKLIVIPGGKHLNGSAGFVQLPECLDVLLEMMK